MKKSRATVLSSILVATMVLGTNFPAAVFAEGTTTMTGAPIERIAGLDRNETAADVAINGWDKSEFAILTPGGNENLVDALTAAPFAKSLNAPILLTEGSVLPEATVEALKKLEVTKVYLVSGVIDKEKIEKAFADKELQIEVVDNLGGKDRFETAAKIAAQLKNVSGVMVTTAYTYADALSVASVAAAKNMPILLADKDVLPEAEAQYLEGIKGDVKTTYVLGGETLVGEALFNELPGSEEGEGIVKKRIAGIDRFETNLKVLKEFGDLKYEKVYVSNGQDDHLVDALVVSTLAAQTNSPIVLADKELSKTTQDLLSEKSSQKIIALGGAAVVDNKVLNSNHVRPQDFAVMQLSGVNGYNVGFEIVDGKTARDLEKVEVTLYKGDTVLAKNVSLNKLFNTYPTATQLSTPFNIDGNFSGDGFWSYEKWNGTTLDIPTKAVITVTYLDGSVYTVENAKLSGNPDDLNKEANNHVKAEDFGVMQASGVNGYSVGFSLVDKMPADLESIEVSLFKTDDKEADILLATNKATRKIFELNTKQLSTPFNIDGSFEDDGYWTYGDFMGTIEDVPSKAVITIEYQDGRKFTVQNTNLTGDSKLLAAPSITSNLAEEVKKGEEVQFGVTTAQNSFAAIPDAEKSNVLVKVTLTQGAKENAVFKYLENDGQFKEFVLDENSSAIYGPAQVGFPLINATSQFKATFNEVGTYGYKLEVFTVTENAQDSQVLATYEGQVVVKEAASEVQ